MTLKEGIIVQKGNDKRKVLAVVGSVVLLSDCEEFTFAGWWYTEEELKDRGYTWDEPAWEPTLREKYYYISGGGIVYESRWDDDAADNGCRDFLGVYPTEEAAKAALAEIKRKLGKV